MRNNHGLWLSLVVALGCGAGSLSLDGARQAACLAKENDTTARSTFVGKVIGISDGDTITVLQNQRSRKIRLNGIDCPEKGQAFGNKASDFTGEACFGKDVTVNSFGYDRYHRTIADVILPDGRNLNEELVKAGYAWWFRKYAPDSSRLKQLEDEARARKAGLWQDGEPVAPWDFRRAKSNNYVGSGAGR